MGLIGLLWNSFIIYYFCLCYTSEMQKCSVGNQQTFNDVLQTLQKKQRCSLWCGSYQHSCSQCLKTHQSLWYNHRSYYFRNKIFTFYDKDNYRFIYNLVFLLLRNSKEILILLNYSFCKNHCHISTEYQKPLNS